MINLPLPRAIAYNALLNDIERGVIKIPQFQRDYVWSKENAAKLIDSILKGYPIGTFITWKTKEQLRVIKNLGNYDLPIVPAGDFSIYVLDGQQRMTSLFCALKGVSIKREKSIDNFSEIYIDLNASQHDQIVVVDNSQLKFGEFINLTNLLSNDFTMLASFRTDYGQKLHEYRNTIQGYQFSLIEVVDAPLDVATEIFTRINIGGKPLTLFEIMVAKTFDAEKQFDLAEKFDQLRLRLANVGYDTISSATVLQTIALVTGTECKRQNILQLDKARFIEEWFKVASAIESAVDYFRSYYRIPVSNLLPYNTLLAPFSYFFYKHKDKPIGDKQRYLEDFMWRVSLGGRYSSSVESKLAQDIDRIDKILENEKPEYDWAIDTSSEFINKNGWFNTGRSYIKALLCILAYYEPKSFVDGSIVHISNDWLKQANSRNYHHFFPRSFLRKNNINDDLSNHIGNITIVDDYLNKREIAAKAPSVYMNNFSNKNPELKKHMETHLIELDSWGIWDDDYEIFLQKRCKRLSDEIKKRLIFCKNDTSYQPIYLDDVEEDYNDEI